MASQLIALLLLLMLRSDIKNQQKQTEIRQKKGSGKSTYCTALAAHAQVRQKKGKEKKQKKRQTKKTKGSGKSTYCTALAAHAQVRFLVFSSIQFAGC